MAAIEKVLCLLLVFDGGEFIDIGAGDKTVGLVADKYDALGY